MEQERDKGSISQRSMCVDSSNQCIFFILQAPGSHCFFGDKLDRAHRIILNELLSYDPSEVALEAHECSIDAGKLQPERRLQIGPVANQQRECNVLWSKGPLLILSVY